MEEKLRESDFTERISAFSNEEAKAEYLKVINKRDLKRLNHLLSILLVIGAVISITIALLLTVYLDSLNWNSALGLFVLTLYMQEIYYVLGLIYKFYPRKSSFIIVCAVNLASIAVMLYCDAKILSELIEYYDNTLSPALVPIYENIGAELFVGTIFYIIFVSITLVVFARHYARFKKENKKPIIIDAKL